MRFTSVLLILVLFCISCVSPARRAEDCHAYAESEVARIVPTPPHELRCSGGEAEANHIQYQIWARDNAYNQCMKGKAQ